MTALGLVYLLRARNGPEPVNAFVESYRRHGGGREHELIVLYKGFRAQAATTAYDSCWKEVPHRGVVMKDHGYDLDAYFRVLSHAACARFCFLNSFSRIQDPDWLSKLSHSLDVPGVGLVGASGSWESLYSNARDERLLGLERSVWRRWLRPVRLAWLRRRFPPFPNPNVRTTAFIAERRVLERIVVPRMRFKFEALEFESGHASLTRQVQALGLQVRVTGRDGRAYHPDDWAKSRTYRQGAQENLLVTDNRTRQYDQAGPVERARLSRLAWGNEAQPDPGAGQEASPRILDL
jgi:hypothetical protein